MDGNEVILTGLKLLVVVMLVLLNGFFVAAEFAIVKIRDTQLIPLISRNNRRAQMARRLVHNLDASLSATQLGITLASLGLGWVGEPVFFALVQPLLQWLQVESAHLQHTIAFVIGFSVITFLHIVAGELAPKSLAIQKPMPTSLWVAYPLWWFYRLSYPAIWALNGTSLQLLRWLGVQPASEAEMVHSDEELRLLVASAQKISGASALGRDIVLNALDLRRRIARDVMRPRQEITYLDTQATLDECFEVVEKTRFSRFPLCEGGRLDKTLGVVHIKDLIVLRLKAKSGADLVPVVRKLIYVPETARLEKLIQLFLERKLHMAIVVDEYGGTLGLLTMENILEELVGQIQDEFDQELPLVVRQDEQTWELLGALPLHELAEMIGEPLAGEGISTTSGWITHRLGGFPKEGDVLPVGTHELQVTKMDGPRVARIKLRRVARPEQVVL